MKFFRVKHMSTLHGFGDSIGSVPILHKPLEEWQAEGIASISGTLYDVGSTSDILEEESYFTFPEEMFFSPQLLKKALKKALGSQTSLQFCLKHNTFNERFVLPFYKEKTDVIELPLFYHVGQTPPQKLVLEQELYLNHVSFPSQIIQGGLYHMDQCDTFGAVLISPFHLLQVNIAMNLNRTLRLQNKLSAKLKSMFGQVGSKWFYRGLRMLNKIGKNTRIHPSAKIEGSIIGDNVTIGANSIVRLSVVDADCTISDNISVINSVLGRGSFIANSNYVNNCMTYEEVFLIHGPYQLSIFGKNVSVFAVLNCDIRLDQNTIRIPTSKGIIDSRQPVLGIAYGHRSRTGAGNIIAAGRLVPNDKIINPPDTIILRFDS